LKAGLKAGTKPGIRAGKTALALGLVLLAASGCRQNMHNQHKLEAYEGSDFFADGQGSRQLPEAVVPLGTFGAEIAPYTGLVVTPAAQNQDAMPAMSIELLRRGQERFNIFCSPCHGRAGEGNGMIVQRGYKQPTSFHDPRLLAAQADYFVTVMTEGFGVMPSYKEEVPVRDRWAIAAYIRALQYSQNARLAELPEAQRQIVISGMANPGGGTAGLSSGHEGGTGSSVHRPAPPREMERRPDPNEVSEEP
jgi:mono/diheme cytochrome c family protein